MTEGVDDYVNVTVRATGFPGPQFDVDDITIMLTTESGSAVGKHLILLVSLFLFEFNLSLSLSRVQLGRISMGSSEH